MSQYKKQPFTLLINILKNAELRMIEIKDKLYSDKQIHFVASISPKDRIYAVEVSLAEMKRIFESLKPFIEVGEYISYCSADKRFNNFYGSQNKEVVEII